MKREYFGKNIAGAGHSRKSLRGGAVAIASRGVNAVVQIASILFLARLLSPEDYGLVSMVTALTGFATIFVDLGTRDAVVQKAHVTEGEVSALFWIVCTVGAIFSALVAASGPLIARFYGEPRLTAIALINSLTFITLALTCQHLTLLRRAMRFEELAFIDVAANILSAALTLVLALYGFGYWALVLRPITTNCLTAVGAWARCGWIPSSPTFTPDVWKMLKFGGHLTGFTLTDFAGRSGDRVAIGYRVGPAGLGYYQNALLVYDNILDVLVGPLHNVATASLSKLGNNPSELHRLWAKALSTLAFFAMPVFGLLAVLGQDLIVVVLGAKWQASAVLLSVIALRGIPQVVERTLGWLHVAAGRTDRWMRWGLFALGVQMTALLAGLPFGPIGVAWAQVLSMFILFVPAIAYAGRPLGIGVLDVIAIVGRPLGGTLACVILGFTLRYTVLADTGAFLRMFVLSATYAVSYLIIVVGILDMRSPFTLGLSLARDVLPARLQRWVPQFSSAL